MVDQITPLLISIRNEVARLNKEMATIRAAAEAATGRPQQPGSKAK
jgi:hypothetical protein